MRNRLLSSILFFCFVLSYGCNSSPSVDREPNETEEAEETIVAPEECFPIENDAIYQVRFDSFWSRENFPDSFPANAQMLNLVGASHTPEYRIWEFDQPASNGLQVFAESGAQQELLSEIRQGVRQRMVGRTVSSGGIVQSPGRTEFNIRMSNLYPVMTLVSKISPSPDWFVGVNRLTLCRNNRWIDQGQVDLYALDAGTDSGDQYQAANRATIPKDSIGVSTAPLFNTDSQPQVIGRFLFIRID